MRRISDGRTRIFMPNARVSQHKARTMTGDFYTSHHVRPCFLCLVRWLPNEAALIQVSIQFPVFKL